MTFVTDLRAWLDRHSLSAYAAAPILGTTQATVGRWLKGTQPQHEKAVRALMREYEETPQAGFRVTVAEGFPPDFVEYLNQITKKALADDFRRGLDQSAMDVFRMTDDGLVADDT